MKFKVDFLLQEEVDEESMYTSFYGGVQYERYVKYDVHVCDCLSHLLPFVLS